MSSLLSIHFPQFTRVLNIKKLFFTKKYTFPQVQLCARTFKAEISPDTAADTFLLADRHGLGELKQVGKMLIRTKRQGNLFLGGDSEDCCRKDQILGKHKVQE